MLIARGKKFPLKVLDTGKLSKQWSGISTIRTKFITQIQKLAEEGVVDCSRDGYSRSSNISPTILVFLHRQQVHVCLFFYVLTPDGASDGYYGIPNAEGG